MHRQFICTAVVLLCSAMAVQAFAQEQAPSPKVEDLRAVHVFTEKVYIDLSSYSVGNSKYGNRNIVPITGGSFEGPSIKGEVLPGGADWQLRRPDGDTELNARYTLRTNDGYTIQVINKVLEHNDASGRYTRSVLDFEAPIGSPYEWLNHAVFVGTMGMGGEPPKQGEKFYVTIYVFKLL
jgi:hypothetical protein